MRIIEPSVEIVTPIDGAEIMKHIEMCGRTCYKSESKSTDAERFVRRLIKRGHESVLEHFAITVKFVVDRGVSHELVRHRLASYSQESTRRCDYANELTFIKPCFWSEDSIYYDTWKSTMEMIEKIYKGYRKFDVKPEEARSILPNSLKTEIVTTANLREWRTILKLRTAKDAHPQMRRVMLPLLATLKEKLPAVFDDIV